MAEPVINRLELTYVRCGDTDTDKKRKLLFEWELDVKGMGIQYTYKIMKNGIPVVEADFTDEYCDCRKKVDFECDDVSAGYKLCLCGKNQPNASDTKYLVLSRFTNPGGSFDGERFDLTWDVEGQMPGKGCCSIYEGSTEGNPILSIPINNPSGRKLVTDRLYFPAKDILYAVFTASDGKICEGPDSAPLVFVPAGIDILAADIEEHPDEDRNKLTLMVSCGKYADQQVKVLLKKNGRTIYQSDALTLVKTQNADEAVVSVDIDFTRVRPEVLSQCVASCIYVSGNTESAILPEQSEISLALPEVEPLAVGKECRARVGIKSPTPPAGFELSGNKGIVAKEGICSGDFAARAVYYARNGKTVSMGPLSKNGFPECFFVENGAVHYRSRSLDEEKQTLALPGSVFSGEPHDAVSTDNLSIEPKSGEYLLTVSADSPVEVEEYQEFLDKLCSDGSLTPEGFYRICGAVMRMCAYKNDDTAFFQCRYSPKDRTADIVPGLIMRTETAMYMPQYDAKIKDCAGFVRMNMSENAVCLGANGFLEWDSFASGMAEGMNSSLSADRKQVIYAAGTEDFLQTSMRQPYYRIMYPSAFPVSDYVTPYASDNVIILASDQYSKILAACSAVIENPASINNLNIPVLVFRGRGMLSLMMQICVNGVPNRVPAGSTIEQALACSGVDSVEHARLFRRGIHGNELRVFGKLEGIRLLQGDRIEV